MRDIKFRAWDKHLEDMEDSDFYLYIENGHLYEVGRDGIDSDNLRHRYVLMQYTGFKDKNGTDIYESDFIKVPDHSYRTHDQEVKAYVDGRVNFNNGQWCVSRGFEYWEDLIDIYESCEVVGNFYENPELVEEEQ